MRGLSRHARVALRREKRRQSAGELNLVSMIDILTVLVFFLLVNSTGVAVLGVNMPDSTKTVEPDANRRPLTVIITPEKMTLTEGESLLGEYGSAESAYQFENLTGTLRDVKAKRPDETKITLLLSPLTSHDTLVKTMDAVRITPSADGRKLLELFPNISLGDSPTMTATSPAAAEVLP